jgi:hypothetical protein
MSSSKEIARRSGSLTGRAGEDYGPPLIRQLRHAQLRRVLDAGHAGGG